MPSFAEVDAAYNQLLGRSLSDAEYGFWAGNDNFRNEIAGSPEAISFRTRTNTPVPVDVTPPPYNPPNIEGYDRTKLADLNYHSEKYDFGRAWAGDPNNVRAAAALIGAQVLDDRTIRTSAGRVIDLYRASSTYGFRFPQWLDVTESPFEPAAVAVTPAYAVSPVTLTARQQIVGISHAETGSTALSASQDEQAGRNRTLVSSGSFVDTGGGFTAGVAGSPSPLVQARAASQQIVAARPTKPRGSGNLFTRGIRALGRGLKGVGKGIRKVATSPVGAVALGIGVSAFLPGVGPIVRSGISAAARTGAKIAVGVGKGVRAGVRHLIPNSGPAGTPPFVDPNAAAAYGVAGASSRSAIAAGIGQFAGNFLAGAFQSQQQQQDLVWDLDAMANVGYIPDPPFLMVMAGQVETVIDAAIDAQGFPVFAIDPDGMVVSALDIVVAEMG